MLSLKKGLDKNRHNVYIVIMTPGELKKWREESGLSQAKLASILGVDVMTVSRWERGIVPTPPFLHFALYGIERMEKKGGGIARPGVKKIKKGGKAE